MPWMHRTPLRDRLPTEQDGDLSGKGIARRRSELGQHAAGRRFCSGRRAGVECSTGAVVGPTRKILLLAAASGELENAVPGTMSAVLRKILGDVAARGLDAAAFGTQADDGVTPQGLLHNVTPVTAAAAGPDAMSNDIGALPGMGIGTVVDPVTLKPFAATISPSIHELTIKRHMGNDDDADAWSTLRVRAVMQRIIGFGRHLVEPRFAIDGLEQNRVPRWSLPTCSRFLGTGSSLAAVASSRPQRAWRCQLRAQLLWRLKPGAAVHPSLKRK